MLRLLLFPFFAAGFSFHTLAQCPPSTTEGDHSSSETASDGSGSGFDFSFEPVPVKIGLGISSIIQSYSTDISGADTRIDNRRDWLNDHAAYTGIISWSPGVRRKWDLGMSFSGQRLDYMHEDISIEPGGELSAGWKDRVPLSMSYKRKANVFGQSIYAEYTLFRIGRQISFFGRADVGYNRYKAIARISYRDTCDCYEQVASEKAVSYTLTAGTGVGVRWEYNFIGVKAMLGYTVQSANSFVTKDQLATWGWRFDDHKYEFNGSPAGGLFHIDRPGYDKVKSRSSQLYVQFVLYINLGYVADEEEWK